MDHDKNNIVMRIRSECVCTLLARSRCKLQCWCLDEAHYCVVRGVESDQFLESNKSTTRAGSMGTDIIVDQHKQATFFIHEQSKTSALPPETRAKPTVGAFKHALPTAYY